MCPIKDKGKPVGDCHLEPRNATVRAEDLQTKYLERGILLDVPFSWQAL